ncbi:hypothetical protein TraAM80_08212 [Trypanosoma rangeli]|uniref:Uncharacterized protein n=1 Tax=Trypanosoma rangeli TaxID=5698 RepID=A0A422N1Q3_TRYRA|nr:uncharacterized protein TraAM80_08212 [Trypanosoma rangeli]RNE99391.1 hypothetical protein TraAM80_08212 [Trypanosoma rangeli]|eukprot:RNE99391.1 hypothetical protein TraAM80_08212 [Trypanosoma rangeli]
MDCDELVGQTFLRWTKKFFLLLEWVVGVEFGKILSLDFCNDHVLSMAAIFNTLEYCGDKKLPLRIFKGRCEMFRAYWSFMSTTAYNFWLRQKIFTLKCVLLLRSNSLEAVLHLEPCACRLYAILMSLHCMLDEERKRPLLDVLLLKKLFYLTEIF